MTTCTSPYDFSTIYGDFYKTAYHFRNEFGPDCEYETKIPASFPQLLKSRSKHKFRDKIPSNGGMM